MATIDRFGDRSRGKDTLTGEPLGFEKYKGAAWLVVNLASQ